MACKTSKVVPEDKTKYQCAPTKHSQGSTPRGSPTRTGLTSKGRWVEAPHHQRSSIPSDVSHETPSSRCYNSCPAKSTRVGAFSQEANRVWIYFTPSYQRLCARTTRRLGGPYGLPRLAFPGLRVRPRTFEEGFASQRALLLSWRKTSGEFEKIE